MRLRLAILLCALLPLMAISAKKPQSKSSLTTEQEQQFTYYWYAAMGAMEHGDYPKALVLFEFCDAIHPNDGKTLEYLGILYLGMGQEERAMDAFKRAFEADPRDCWYRYSSALLEQKTEEAMVEAMHVRERALKVNPEDEDLMERLQRVYISLKEWKKAKAEKTENAEK